MENVTLPNVSLAAIVRDEMMNPAGGIVDFVESVMPFVESGVIVDTGSLDGTRETLEELTAKYPNLKIYDHLFNGYGPSRNFSLDMVKTNYALMLDADERLNAEDFENISSFLKLYPDRNAYKFSFKHLDFMNNSVRCPHHSLRLINAAEGVRYDSDQILFETLFLGGYSIPNVQIKHFVPNNPQDNLKRYNWYGPIRDIINNGDLNELTTFPAPSQIKGFEKWKQLSPARSNYYFGS